jgi:hypothetical protein
VLISFCHPTKFHMQLQRLARTIAIKKERDFDPRKFLAIIGEGRRIVLAPRKENIYAQGEASDAVFYIQKGTVRLTVLSKDGKEATIGILNPGDFCGEGCLTGQPLRLGSAAAMTDCELMRIDKKAMMLALRREQTLSATFTAYLLGRNIRYAKVEIPPSDPRDGRQGLPVEVILQHWCVSSRCPGAATMRALAQSAFIDEDDGSSLFLGFFLSSGHRCFFQRRMAGSFRSNARPAGRWQLQPICRRIFQTCPGWYRMPHSRSIKSATRGAVHKLVSVAEHFAASKN